MKYIFFIPIILLSIALQSQDIAGKYWLELKDKLHNNYSVDNPEEFLSARAIERRQRYNIAVTESDLPVSNYYIDSLKSLGCKIVLKSRWFNAVVIQSTDTALLDTIQNISFVDSLHRFSPTAKKNINTKPVENIQSVSDFYNYGNGYNQIHLHKGEILHNNGFRGEGMLIGIIDAGFTNVDNIEGFAHLFNENKIIATYDFVKQDSFVYNYHTHGTQVLSTIASYLPGDFIGTAPEANFVLLRSENGFSEYKIEEDYWIAAIEMADSIGVDVVNTSLGYNRFDDSRQDYTYEDLNGKTARISIAATMAARKGIIVVCSAGNEGANSWHYITVPADADSILTVGAVNSTGDIASFSSRGPTSDGRTKPDIVAKGLGTTVLAYDGNVSSGSGTSFASPLMAGLVACFWQANKDKNNMEIIDIIKRYSSQYNSPDNIKGYGIPDFEEALEVSYIGSSLSDDKFLYKSENPVKQNIRFSVISGYKQNILVYISDITGKTVYTNNYTAFKKSAKDFNISATNLNNGIYVINVITEHKHFSYKVVK